MNKEQYDRILLPLGFMYWNVYPQPRRIPFIGSIQGDVVDYRRLGAATYPGLHNCTQVWIPGQAFQTSRALKWAERYNRATLLRHGITDELIEVSKVLEFCP